MTRTKQLMTLCAVLAIAVTASAYFYQTAPEISRVLLRAPAGEIPEETSLRVAAIKDTALSRTSLVTAMRNYGLYRDHMQRMPVEDVVEIMKEAITVERINDGRIEIVFRGENSKAVADHLARPFQDAGFESEGATTDPPAK